MTGVIGFDDFDPVRLESCTFIALTGESLMHLMTFTGSTIDFGVAAVGGVIVGCLSTPSQRAGSTSRLSRTGAT